MTYQTEKPMVPFLADSLEDILRTFSSKFIQKATLRSHYIFNDGMIDNRPTDVDLGFAIKLDPNNLGGGGGGG